MVFSFPLLNFPDCHFAICCQVELNYLICLGIMMTLAWVLFAFVGLFTARYMREVWEPRQLLGEKAWFTVSTVKKKNLNKVKAIVHGELLGRLVLRVSLLERVDCIHDNHELAALNLICTS